MTKHELLCRHIGELTLANIQMQTEIDGLRAELKVAQENLKNIREQKQSATDTKE